MEKKRGTHQDWQDARGRIEQGWNNLNFFDYGNENGSSQGRNPALTGLVVPRSLNSGPTRLVTLSKVDSDAPLSSQKVVSIVISLKSIHPQTRQLNCITMNGKEQVDGVVGELTLEKRC